MSQKKKKKKKKNEDKTIFQRYFERTFYFASFDFLRTVDREEKEKLIRWKKILDDTKIIEKERGKKVF